MKITIAPGESLDLSAAPGATLTQSGWTITAQADTQPPPTVPPGTIVFESTFETADYALWTQTNGFFENGNTKTHNGPPVPPEMGLRSLRMKQANGTVAGGNFPPGAGDEATRIVNLAAGDYEVHLWRVAHDTGEHIFSVYDDDGDALGSWEGTAGLDETEWKETVHPFTLDADGPVTLEFYYDAPSAPTQATGVKCALLRIVKA